MRDKMKTILVTGGTGFIGANLCRKLLQDSKNKVICLDNNYTGSLDNVKDLLENANFEFIEHDVINPLNLDQKIDEIYNLACPASPKAYQGDRAIFTTKTCVFGALNMLELARKNNAKILQTSTSEVYGEPLEHPQKENYRGNVNPIGVRSCYDEGKRCAESLFFDYNRIYGVKVKVVRIFNTYGPYMHPDDGRVVSNFICQALKGVDLTVFGDGSQTRSFCYVDDLVCALILTMKSDDEFLGPINLGNPEEYTIGELSQIIKNKVNKNLKVLYKPLPADDPTQRRPDVELAKNKLKWQPQTKLDEGLDKTIEYFKNKLEEIY